MTPDPMRSTAVMSEDTRETGVGVPAAVRLAEQQRLEELRERLRGELLVGVGAGSGFRMGLRAGPWPLARPRWRLTAAMRSTRDDEWHIKVRRMVCETDDGSLSGGCGSCGLQPRPPHEPNQAGTPHWVLTPIWAWAVTPIDGSRCVRCGRVALELLDGLTRSMRGPALRPSTRSVLPGASRVHRVPFSPRARPPPPPGRAEQRRRQGSQTQQHPHQKHNRQR